MNQPAAHDHDSDPLTTGPNPGWWLQVIRVRLRFLIIVLAVGAFVSQWQLLRSVWDRWVWSFSRKMEQGTVTSTREYFCPMDPGVISVWPAICPICNMDLVPRNKMDAVLLPEGVVARMQLSPYRIQLAGIKTVEVQPRELKYVISLSGLLKSFDRGAAGLESNISTAECPLFMTTQPAVIRWRDLPETFPATAQFIEGSFPPRIRIVLDDPKSLPVGAIVDATVKASPDDSTESLAVPHSAVVDHGSERLVYVETMPGMFDAVTVELGRRCGEYYPVAKGLKAGQRVALAGAFLIDAETRLNPSMAAGYFGASPTESKAAAPAPITPAPVVAPQAKTNPTKKPKNLLSPEDQKLADQQRICPVTELPLNSMGGPVTVTVAGRKVFICCSGCEKRLKDDPDKYLSRISAD